MYGERNGKGIEYNYFGNLLFEGEFKHGKRNGKGNEYNYFGELIFEGKYLHGKRNGRGKEYNDGAGELKFEGEYLNGKKLIGIKYDGLGNILYKYNNANGKEKNLQMMEY